MAATSLLNAQSVVWTKRYQREKAARRAMEMLLKGGECNLCRYRKNLAALEFHHTDAHEKEFQLDLRSLSNRSWPRILGEVQKCILICSNCHRELHNTGSDLAE